MMTKLGEFATHTYVSPTYFAEYHAEFGDNDQAMEWLQKAYRERDPNLAGLKVDDSFDNIRSDPRFQDLERRVGFR